MAEKLLEEGNEVLGVDICEERVNDAMGMLTDAQIGVPLSTVSATLDCMAK